MYNYIQLAFSPRGVLWTSSDGDDRRIFLGLEFLITGFFCVGKNNLKIGQEKTIWYSKQSEDLPVMPAYPGHVGTTKLLVFCLISFNLLGKLLGLGILAWDFLGVNFWPRDFLGFCGKS